MIIEKVLDVIYNLFDLMLVFDLPSMPSSVSSYISDVIGYVTSGINLLSGFIGSSAVVYCSTLLIVVISIESTYLIYKFVMWILKKIPFLGIE